MLDVGYSSNCDNCIVKFTYIGQIYHCTEEKIDNVLSHYGIAVHHNFFITLLL